MPHWDRCLGDIFYLGCHECQDCHGCQGCYHITLDITSPQNITSPRGSVAALLLLEENPHISDLEGQRLVSVTQWTYHWTILNHAYRRRAVGSSHYYLVRRPHRATDPDIGCETARVGPGRTGRVPAKTGRVRVVGEPDPLGSAFSSWNPTRFLRV
jgi:hypothetical protein